MLYKPLNTSKAEIRLLLLKPSPCRNDRLRCSFKTVSLDKFPSFEALSYVWGDSTSQENLRLKCRRLGFVVAKQNATITRSLDTALRHIRNSKKKRLFWIDAVCINQADNEEKSSQIPLMSRIYSQAFRIIAWMGEGFDGSDIAIEALEQMSHSQEMHLLPEHDHYVHVKKFDLESEELRCLIAQFFKLPWWQRIWTIQERTLAKQVTFQCGTRCMDGAVLPLAVANFLTHSMDCCKAINHWFSEPLSSGPSIHDVARESLHEFISINNQFGNGQLKFLDLVTASRNKLATSEHDKLYGLLGLDIQQTYSSLPINYSTPSSDVYAQFVHLSIGQTGSLDVLSHCVGYRGRNLPSFVPDFAEPIANLSDHLSYLDTMHLYHADGNRQAVWLPLEKDKVLTQALFFDTITEIESSDADTAPSEVWQEICRVANLDPSAYAGSEKPIQDALWRAVCGDVQSIQGHLNDSVQRLPGSIDTAKYKAWLKWYLSSEDQTSMEFENEIGSINTRFRAISAGRCFVSTARGYLGWGPDACQIGDPVVLIPGGKVPYVLRAHVAADSSQGGKRMFTFLGDAYIEGLMNGEAFDDSGEAAVAFQDVLLI